LNIERPTSNVEWEKIKKRRTAKDEGRGKRDDEGRWMREGGGFADGGLRLEVGGREG
jgi:hypothetical protein